MDNPDPDVEKKPIRRFNFNDEFFFNDLPSGKRAAPDSSGKKLAKNLVFNLDEEILKDTSGNKKKLTRNFVFNLDEEIRILRGASAEKRVPVDSSGKKKKLAKNLVFNLDAEIKILRGTSAEKKVPVVKPHKRKTCGTGVIDVNDQINENNKRPTISYSNDSKKMKLVCSSGKQQDKPKAAKKLFSKCDSKLKTKKSPEDKFTLKIKKLQHEDRDASEDYNNFKGKIKMKPFISTPVRNDARIKKSNVMEKIDECLGNMINSPSVTNKGENENLHELTREFEENELLCGLNDPSIEKSPLTTITNTLKRTSISDSPIKLQQLIALKRQMENDFKIFQCQAEEYKKKYEFNMKKLDSYINSPIKENANFKLPKVQYLSPKQFAIDLRKATLNKNYIKAADNSKWERSIDLYNALRNDHIGLSTPKSNKAMLDTPKVDNGKTALSVKLQKQCLMLLDTPKK